MSVKKDNISEVKSYKWTTLKNNPPKNAVLYVLDPLTKTIELFITDKNGVPRTVKAAAIDISDYVDVGVNNAIEIHQNQLFVKKYVSGDDYIEITDLGNRYEVTFNDGKVELKENKQDSLDPDGTGTKYPTVDAVNEAINNIQLTPGKSAYEVAVDNGFVGTEAQWLASLVGQDGHTPYINSNGNWEVNGVDTGIPAQGEDGLSAYEVWISQGNTGSEQDFLNSLIGEDGKSAYQIWIDEGNTGSIQDFFESLQGDDGKSAYQEWLDLGNSGSPQDFIDSLKGVDGVDGQDGSVVTIGGNNNWFIDGVDTGVKAVGEDGTDGQDGYTPIKGIDYFDGQDGYTPIKNVDYFDGQDGTDGKSAYEVWVEEGNTGTIQDYLDSLKGDDGEDGLSAYEVAVLNGFVGTEIQWLQSLKGDQGLSSYQVWLSQGNTGTVQDYLDSLKGDDGTDGVDGKSAYEIWIEEGNSGTIQDFIDSLKGDKGDNGLSAYEVAVLNGFVGTEMQWLQSLVGEQGLSAYQAWLSQGNTGTPQDFLDSLQGQDGYTPIKGIDYFDGQDGESAYQEWLDLGNSGTPQDFIDSLRGTDGVDGQDGSVITIGGNNNWFIDGVDTGVKAIGEDGIDGVDGYTPIKGIDYFDGQDGYTPVKNIDYFDGQDGTDGNTWFGGVSNPAGATGTTGDWYINTTTWEVFEKTGATTWTLRGNIKGEQGVQGIQGIGAIISAATASVSNTTGVPNVVVTLGGTPGNRSFHFDFTNLKGQDGADGKDGTGVRIVGTLPDTSQLPIPPATPEDAYIIDGDLWVWDDLNGNWVNAGPIQGPQGVAGPPNVLNIGTVTTGAPGAPASATITGTSPSQILNLVIPEGLPGSNAPTYTASDGIQIASNNIRPVYGSTVGTVAQGNDPRFHDAITLGTPNGLSLSGQVLSLGTASSTTTGALTAADWILFNSKTSANDGNISYTGTGAITGGGLSTANQSGDTSYTFDLLQSVKEDIADGVTAFSWGDHNLMGYLTSANLTGYATEIWVQTGFSPLVHTHITNHVTALTGYVLGANTPILATDSLNEALGKIQAQIDAKGGTVTSITAGTGLSGGTITTSGTISLNPTTIASLNLANTALQSGDNVSELINDAGYITSASLPIVNNGQLNLSTGSGLSGSATFTANQNSNSNFNVTLLPATATTIGGIELFSNTVQTVAANAVTATAGRTYGIQFNSDGQAVVNVPWLNTNTIYTAGTGINISGSNVITNTSPNITQILGLTGNTLTLSNGGGSVDLPTYTDTITRLRGTASGTFVSGDITLLAGTNTTISQTGNNITISSANTLYTAGTGLTLSGTIFSLPITYSGSGNYIANIVTNANGLTVTRANLPTFTDAITSISRNGLNIPIVSQNVDIPIFDISGAGLVPERVGSTTTRFLREDGTWVIPANTTYSLIPIAELNTGTSTTARTVNASVLTQWITPLLDSKVDKTTTITINGTAFDLSTNRTWTIPDTNTITRLRGLTTGTFTSGDITLLAGANTSISQSGTDITISSTNTNTTYTAGSGLTLTGTVFSLPVTISGSGSFVQTVTQTTNGLTVTLGTPPNTTYSTGALAELNTGTVSTGRLWGANVLNQWIDGKGFATENWVLSQGYITSYVDTITRVGTVSGNLTSGDILIQGAGNTTVNKTGNTLTVSSTSPTYTGSVSILLSGTSFQRAALTGDVTSPQNSNTTTITNNSVTFPKMQNIGTNVFLGRNSTGTGNIETLTPAQALSMLGVQAGANNYVHPNHTGDVTSVGDGTTTIANNVVTFAKMQNINTQRLLGRGAAGVGSIQEITLGANLTLSTAGVLTATNTNTTYTGANGIQLVGTVFSPVYGTAANTVAQGNDSRINNGQTAFGWGNHAGLYVPTSRTLTAGNGLSGGGNLTANRTFTLGTPGAVTLSSTSAVTSTSHTHAFTPGGTTAQYIRGNGSLATFPTLQNLTAGNHIDITSNAISVKPTLGVFIQDSGNNDRILMDYVPAGSTNHNDLVLKQISADGFMKFRNSKDEDFFVYRNSTEEVMFPLVGSSTGTTSNIVTMGSNGAMWRSNRTIGDLALVSQIPTNYITTNTTQTGLSGNKTTNGWWAIIPNNSTGIAGSQTPYATVIRRSGGNYGSLIEGYDVNGDLGYTLRSYEIGSTSQFELYNGTISSQGYKKYGQSNSSVLLAGGGHRPVSDFALASAIPNNYITTNSTQAGLSGDKTTSGTWNFTSSSATSINVIRTSSTNSSIGYGVSNSVQVYAGLADSSTFAIGDGGGIGNLNTVSNRWMWVDNTGRIYSKNDGDSSQWNTAYQYVNPNTLSWLTTNTTNSTGHTHELSIDVFARIISDLNQTSDLNDIGDNYRSGFASVASQANAQLALNYPWEGGGGSLLNFNTGTTYKTQIFHNRGGTRIAYRAKISGSTYRSWVEFITDLNLDSQATSLGFIKSSALPTVNNGQLTLSTGTGLTGSATFTANQSGSSTFSVAVASTHKLPTTAEWASALVNTTYSAGTGLSLTGTTFGQTITTNGTGSFVTGITQTTNGFQINLGTPPNTTYTGSNGINVTGTVISPTYGTAANTIAQGNDSRINNGQTAFGWGNHASAGYLTSSALPNMIGTSATTGDNIANNSSVDIDTLTGSQVFLSTSPQNLPFSATAIVQHYSIASGTHITLAADYINGRNDYYLGSGAQTSVNSNWRKFAFQDWVLAQDYATQSQIVTPNNGQLTLSTGTGLTGSQTFSANQAGNATFSVGIASTHKLPTTAEWNALPTTNTITRLRGTTSGTFTSGDLTLLAGANTTITQSGANITIASTNTNTTYSAGTGLSLSGTTFGQTITTSGTGTFVTGITQTTNGFQINLGTPPNTNTTYTGSNGINVTGTVISPTYGTTANTIAQGNDSRINNGQTAFAWVSLGGVSRTSVLLNSSNDLDLVIEPGYYHHNGGSAPLNAPMTGAGYLEVVNNGTNSYVRQAWRTRDFRREYQRTKGPTTWSAWVEYITTDNLDSEATSLGFIKSSSLSGYVPTSRTLTAGNGLTGGGNLTANRTFTLGTPSAITLSSTNSVAASSHTHAFTPGGTSAQYIRGDGSLATYANTTYSAGSGLTLSGTTFSLPVTVSGTGTYVQSVTQTASGITVTLGTPPNTNTTYSNMAIAELNAGTVATGRIISASVLNQWLNAKGFSTQTLTAGTNISIVGNVISATNTNTTYSAGTGLSLTGTVFANTAPNATHTGDVTGATALTISNNAVTTAKIINSAVTHAKYQNIAQNTFLGRIASGSGSPTALTVAQMQSVLGIPTNIGVTNVSATVAGNALNVNVTNPSTIPALGFTWAGNTNQVVLGNGSLAALPINTVTQIGVNSSNYSTGSINFISGTSIGITKSGNNVTVNYTGTASQGRSTEFYQFHGQNTTVPNGFRISVVHIDGTEVLDIAPGDEDGDEICIIPCNHSSEYELIFSESIDACGLENHHILGGISRWIWYRNENRWLRAG